MVNNGADDSRSSTDRSVQKSRVDMKRRELRNILTKFKLYQFNALTVQNHSDLIKKEIYALVVDIAKLEKSFYDFDFLQRYRNSRSTRLNLSKNSQNLARTQIPGQSQGMTLFLTGVKKTPAQALIQLFKEQRPIIEQRIKKEIADTKDPMIVEFCQDLYLLLNTRNDVVNMLLDELPRIREIYANKKEHIQEDYVRRCFLLPRIVSKKNTRNTILKEEIEGNRIRFKSSELDYVKHELHFIYFWIMGSYHQSTFDNIMCCLYVHRSGSELEAITARYESGEQELKSQKKLNKKHVQPIKTGSSSSAKGLFQSIFSRKGASTSASSKGPVEKSLDGVYPLLLKLYSILLGKSALYFRSNFVEQATGPEQLNEFIDKTCHNFIEKLRHGSLKSVINKKHVDVLLVAEFSHPKDLFNTSKRWATYHKERGCHANLYPRRKINLVAPIEDDAHELLQQYHCKKNDKYYYMICDLVNDDNARLEVCREYVTQIEDSSKELLMNNIYQSDHTFIVRLETCAQVNIYLLAMNNTNTATYTPSFIQNTPQIVNSAHSTYSTDGFILPTPSALTHHQLPPLPITSSTTSSLVSLDINYDDMFAEIVDTIRYTIMF